MPYLKTYDLFISHAWFYSKGYNTLIENLNSSTYFKWRNYSVPEHDPVVDPNSDTGKKLLTEKLQMQIRPVNCVLVISGMYAAYKYWIQKEIELAQYYDKPIIGLIPWGAVKTPQVVQDAAIEMVRWNTDSILDAIRRNSI